MRMERTAGEMYALPEGWKWVTLGDVDQHKSQSCTPAHFPGQLFELYSVPSFEGQYPEILSGNEIGSSKQIVEKGDVLLCKINPRINRVWQVYQYTNNPLLASSEWIIVRNSQVNSDYLMWYFRSPAFRRLMLSNVSGVGGSLMRAQPKFVKKYPIPLPHFPEQERIVSRIETLFTKLDAAEEKVDAALASFAPRRAALLGEAVDGKLTSEWRIAHSVTLDTWQEMPLQECGEWFGGGTPSKSHPEYWDNGDILWITSKDMKSDVIEDTQMHITALGVQNSSAKFIDSTAVLFVMRSGILRHTFPTAIAKPGFTVNQDLKALIPYDGIDPAYLLYAVKAHERDILKTCMKSGTTVESINSNALRRFEVPVPSLPEQKEIVRRLDAILAKEKRAADAARKVKETISLVRQSILARAFRGGL